jgi:hypothetical protein
MISSVLHLNFCHHFQVTLRTKALYFQQIVKYINHCYNVYKKRVSRPKSYHSTINKVGHIIFITAGYIVLCVWAHVGPGYILSDCPYFCEFPLVKISLYSWAQFTMSIFTSFPLNKILFWTAINREIQKFLWKTVWR